MWRTRSSFSIITFFGNSYEEKLDVLKLISEVKMYLPKNGAMLNRMDLKKSLNIRGTLIMGF